MSLVIKQTRVVEVPVNTITLAATCQQAILVDADGQCVGSTNAMPSFMPTLLEIDLATGQIKNWTVPSCEQLQDIADTSEIQRMSEGEYHHFMNDRLFRDAVPLEQSNPLEIEGIKTLDHGWVAGLLVSVNEKAGKWSATTGHHTATSTQGKFEAINGALNKAGMGRCEINQQKDENGHPIEGMYLADDKNTKDRTTVYVSGHEIGKGHTARTSSGKKYTAPTESCALDGLLRDVLKVELPDDAIVDTTDDEMVFNDKQRYSIDMSKAVPIVEPSTTEPDWADGRRDRANDIEIEDAPQPICQPAHARYRNPDDHSQTWTGRGKPPEWLQAKLDAGEQLTDYAISDSAA